MRRDPLTKLLNKLEIQRETDAFLEGAEDGTHVLFLIDIDNFKGVNDNFGHTFGDTVIVDVANIIKSFFRNNDLTGRVGGDEFLVLMKNTTLEKAKERAGNLGEALCKVYTGGPFTTGSRQVLVWPPVTVGMEIHTVPCLKKRIMPCTVPSRGAKMDMRLPVQKMWE